MDAEVRSGRLAGEGKSIAAVILGNDAVAAIRPCATSQLARACVAAGFDIVIPPSWGDELVAGEYLAQLADRLEYAVAPCACALVRSLLDRSTAKSAIGCAFAAAPPVAAARYVRATYGQSVLITFIGDCPSASDPAIDARFSPAGFLASLNRQGISVEDQPSETVGAEADRWRRYRSIPGGIPALRYLARPPVNRVLRDTDTESLTVGLPESRSNIVADFSIAANCVCSGAGASLDDYELPRSQTPIIVAPNGLDLSPAPSPPRVRPTLRARPESAAGPRADASDAVSPPIVGEVRSMLTTVRPAARPRKSNGGPREVRPARSRRQRIALLALVPIVVLLAATALGIAVYRTSGGSPVARESHTSPPPETAVANSITTAATTTDSSMGYVADRTSVDSARARPDRLAADSAIRRRPRVVPGWVPQGQRRFTPIDTSASRRPDSGQPTDAVRPDTIKPDPVPSDARPSAGTTAIP